MEATASAPCQACTSRTGGATAQDESAGAPGDTSPNEPQAGPTPGLAMSPIDGTVQSQLAPVEQRRADTTPHALQITTAGQNPVQAQAHTQAACG